MASSMRTNLSSIALFCESLNAYESSLDTKAIEPSQFVTPAYHFEMALNRLLMASVVDSYQMMRELAKKMILGLTNAYSEFSILMTATSSPSESFKAAMNDTVHALNKLIRGETVTFGSDWFKRVNSNSGIKNFLETYKNSDLNRIRNSYIGNLVKASEYDLGYTRSDESVVSVDIGKAEPKLALTWTNPQTLKFSPAEALSKLDIFKNELPSVIVSKVTVQPLCRSFSLDSSIILSDCAARLVCDIGCLAIPYTYGRKTTINLPGHFYECELDVVSFDSGDSWIVGNLKILPPSV